MKTLDELLAETDILDDTAKSVTDIDNKTEDKETNLEKQPSRIAKTKARSLDELLKEANGISSEFSLSETTEEPITNIPTKINLNLSWEELQRRKKAEEMNLTPAQLKETKLKERTRDVVGAIANIPTDIYEAGVGLGVLAGTLAREITKRSGIAPTAGLGAPVPIGKEDLRKIKEAGKEIIKDIGRSYGYEHSDKFFFDRFNWDTFSKKWYEHPLYAVMDVLLAPAVAGKTLSIGGKAIKYGSKTGKDLKNVAKSVWERGETSEYLKFPEIKVERADAPKGISGYAGYSAEKSPVGWDEMLDNILEDSKSVSKSEFVLSDVEYDIGKREYWIEPSITPSWWEKGKMSKKEIESAINKYRGGEKLNEKDEYYIDYFKDMFENQKLGKTDEATDILNGIDVDIYQNKYGKLNTGDKIIGENDIYTVRASEDIIEFLPTKKKTPIVIGTKLDDIPFSKTDELDRIVSIERQAPIEAKTIEKGIRFGYETPEGEINYVYKNIPKKIEVETKMKFPEAIAEEGIIKEPLTTGKQYADKASDVLFKGAEYMDFLSNPIAWMGKLSKEKYNIPSKIVQGKIEEMDAVKFIDNLSNEMDVSRDLLYKELIEKPNKLFKKRWFGGLNKADREQFIATVQGLNDTEWEKLSSELKQTVLDYKEWQKGVEDMFIKSGTLTPESAEASKWIPRVAKGFGRPVNLIDTPMLVEEGKSFIIKSKESGKNLSNPFRKRKMAEKYMADYLKDPKELGVIKKENIFGRERYIVRGSDTDRKLSKYTETRGKAQEYLNEYNAKISPKKVTKEEFSDIVQGLEAKGVSPAYFPLILKDKVKLSDFFGEAFKEYNPDVLKHRTGALALSGQYLNDPLEATEHLSAQLAKMYANTKFMDELKNHPLVRKLSKNEKIPDGYGAFYPEGYLEFFNAGQGITNKVLKEMDTFQDIPSQVSEMLSKLFPSTVKGLVGVKRGQVYIMPEYMRNKLRENFVIQAKSLPQFAMERATGVFASAVLPNSPKWLINDIVGTTLATIMYAGADLPSWLKAFWVDNKLVPRQLKETFLKMQTETARAGIAQKTTTGKVVDVSTDVAQKILNYNPLAITERFSNQISTNYLRRVDYLHSVKKLGDKALAEKLGQYAVDAMNKMEKLQYIKNDPKIVESLIKDIEKLVFISGRMSKRGRTLGISPYIYRTIFPFWSFMKWQLKTSATLPLNKPQTTNIINKMMELEYNMLPEEYREKVKRGEIYWGEVLDKEGKPTGAGRFVETRFLNPFAMPFVERDINTGEMVLSPTMLSSIFPLWKGVIEFLLQKSLLTGLPLKSSFVLKIPGDTFGTKAPKYIALEPSRLNEELKKSFEGKPNELKNIQRRLASGEDLTKEEFDIVKPYLVEAKGLSLKDYIKSQTPIFNVGLRLAKKAEKRGMIKAPTWQELYTGKDIPEDLLNILAINTKLYAPNPIDNAMQEEIDKIYGYTGYIKQSKLNPYYKEQIKKEFANEGN